MKKLFQDKITLGFLKPDGEMEYSEVMDQLGIAQPEDYLKENEFYEAVVVDVQDSAMQATVRVGPAEVQMPMEEMKWAHRFSNRRIKPPAPKFPSQVVKRGDVILVQIKNTRQTPRRNKKKNTPLAGLPHWSRSQ